MAALDFGLSLDFPPEKSEEELLAENAIQELHFPLAPVANPMTFVTDIKKSGRRCFELLCWSD